MALGRLAEVRPIEGVAGGVPVDVNATITPAANQPTFAVNQKNVAVAGTAEQLQAQAIPDGFSILVTAKTTNTDLIRLADSAANAQNAAVAYLLTPGASISLFITNANLVFIDAVVSGEGVSWIVET